ncbi:MAG: hypothetical protein E3J72_05595, partial [Planctomycetota bacterium]
MRRLISVLPIALLLLITGCGLSAGDTAIGLGVVGAAAAGGGGGGGGGGGVGIPSDPRLPGKVGNPIPPDKKTDIPVDQQLSWSDGEWAAGYFVYIGTTQPVTGTWQANVSTTTCDPGALLEGTTYYWRVDSWNYGDPGPIRETEGDLWTFYTAILTAPEILSAEWLDADCSGSLSDFDEIMVNFNERVTGSVTPGDFELPVTGDSFGSAATAVFMGNESIVIRLGTGPSLTVNGMFNLAATAPGSPSGIIVNTTQIKGEISGLAAAWGYTDIGGTISGSPPPKAVNPVPGDSVINVRANQQLSWDTVAEADWYIVYFGTSSPGAYQGCQSATNFSPGAFSAGQQYFWRIDTLNDFGCTAGTVWLFRAGIPPPQAVSPNPSNGVSGVSLTPDLSWSCGGAITESFDVYFGTTSPGTFQVNVATPSFTPGALLPGTTYYWHIDSLNSLGYGTTAGMVWSFSTGATPGLATGPSPMNNASGVDLMPVLSWVAPGDADGYSVCFGTTDPPPYLVDEPTTIYSPGALNVGTTYYWRIDPYNAFGTTTGNVWKFTTFAPPPGSLIWAKRAGGGSNDYGFGIATLPDGTAFVTGSFEGTATFGNAAEGGVEVDLTSYGGEDAFIAKYNPDGTLAWAKRAGGTNFDRSNDISLLPDGSSYVTGVFEGTATFGNASEGNETDLISAGAYDIFIAKYNPDGTLNWAKRDGGTNNDYGGSGISTLSDGSAIFTGSFRSGTAIFGNASEGNEVTLNSDGWDDIFIAKYNPDGTLNWAKRAGGSGNDGGFRISTLSDGSAIVTGTFAWAGTTATFGNASEGIEIVLTTAGDYDIFIAKYNPDGTLNWVKRAGGGTENQGNARISAFSDGSSVVTGFFQVTATFGNASEGNEEILSAVGGDDIFIAKYNPDGTLNWAKRAGGSGVDYAHAISALPDGSAIITGQFEVTATFGPGETNETDLVSAGTFDMFIAKYYSPPPPPDPGMLVWAKQAGGTGNDEGYDVSTLPDGSAFVTGWFQGTATFGNASEGNEITLTSAGASDVFIAKYNPDGTLAWAKSAGGGNSDYGQGISALSDGSVFVTGMFGVAGTTATFGNASEGNEIVLTSAGNYDMFIAKYNPDGTLAWAKSAGGGGGDASWGISALSDGSAIVTGQFDTTATFGNASEGNETILSSSGGGGIFIATYN